MSKTCSACGVSKPLADFWRRSTSRDGLCSRCKVCTSRRVAAYYAANPGKMAANKRKDNYGITQPQYEELFDSQGGCCAICGSAFENNTPHVDHCHTSGRVRGLLCCQCNSGIGMLRDNPTICQNAVTYLIKNGS